MRAVNDNAKLANLIHRPLQREAVVLTPQLFLTIIRDDFSDPPPVFGRFVGYPADRIFASFFDAEHGLIRQCQEIC